MKSLLTKKNMLIVALAVLLIGTGIAGTLAYLSDKEEALVNTFTIGNVTTEIEEIFEQGETVTTFKKEPVIVNTGENDCYVRARVLVSPEKALGLSGFSENWTLKEDGFYYYNAVLPAATEETAAGKTDALFTQVEVTDTSIDGFEVSVYQEAVQTKVYARDGSFTTDMFIIWKCYDVGVVPDSFY